MKKTFCYCLSAMAIASLLFVACNKEESTPAVPTLTVSTASVIAPADGGGYSFSYTVGNPADDGYVSCASDATWITDLDYSTSGSVTFTISENTTTSARYGNITVSYTSSNGNDSETVVVAQNSANGPELTVEPITFTLSADGGTFEFTYSVENATADGSLSCATEATWISDFDYTTEGTVKFTASANDEEEIRSGVIVATYTATTGVAQQNVLVAQASASAGEDSTPSISVSTPSVIAAKGEGAYSFDYTVTNPVDGGSVSCSADADWISDFDYSTDGTVGFAVSKNPDTGLRSATISVVYTYGEGAVAASVAVVQDYATGFTVEELVGTYSATGFTAETEDDEDSSTWTIKIYDDEAGGLIIDGLSPYYFGRYPSSKQFIAYGEISNFDFYVSVPAYTGYHSGSTYYWWVECPQYNNGWYYSVASGKVTFEYDKDTETWTSDYGLLYSSASSNSSISSISGLYDGFAPGIVLTKVSDSTDDPDDDDETTTSTSSVNSQLHELTPLDSNFRLAK